MTASTVTVATADLEALLDAAESDGHPITQAHLRLRGAVEDAARITPRLAPTPDPTQAPVSVRSDAGSTEVAAALLAAPTAGTMRARVLETIRAKGAHGATDDEIAQALGVDRVNQLASRRRELVDGGWVRAMPWQPSDGPGCRGTYDGQAVYTRRTRTGSPATVWRVTSKGLRP